MSASGESGSSRLRATFSQRRSGAQGRVLSRHAWMAAALALLVVAAGVIWNTRVAAGADAYGYVSQADLWLRGNLFIDQDFAASVPWPLAPWTFTPLGYRPEPAGIRIVPTYPSGLPLLMAAAKAVAGQCALFAVVPIAGGVLVFTTYWIGRRIGRPLVGLAAAWIVATSPAMLFMLMAPMSDVPAAAAWAVAVACLLRPPLPSDGRELRPGSPKRRRREGGGHTPLSAVASGTAAAIAILIRPNLVPLAAVLGLWILIERTDREDGIVRQGIWSLRPLRSLSFAIPASVGAIAVAIINARLYGSPFASGYGDLSEAYSWSYIVPNLQRYPKWLVSTETPLALAGLVCLVVPVTVLWPTRESRRARWLLATFAAGVCFSYLIYVPWDAWWYLRFLLPAWPMMATGTASLLAAMARTPNLEPGTPNPTRIRSMALRSAATCAVIALGVFSVMQARRLDVFTQARGEAKYVEVATAVEAVTSPADVIISGQFSGSLRYYAGRLTLRWDYLDPQWLDRAVQWLDEHGHHPYVLLEAPEAEAFRARFAGTNAVGHLNWVPTVSFRGRSINLYDAMRRDRMEAPIAPPALLAVHECEPAKKLERW